MTRKIYLDNAATSWPKPPVVIEAMSNFLKAVGCNPGRGGYECSLEAGREILKTRETVAGFFGSDSPENVVFNQNVTQALNFALYGLLKKGDHVITSDLEHNAVWRPLKTMEKKGLISLSVYPFSRTDFSEDKFLNLLTPQTRVVVVNHASNITGQIIPVTRVGAVLKERNPFFVVDTAQTAGSIPIDAPEAGIDVTAFTGHKGLLGPPGTGGMLLSERAARNIKPIIQGGTGSISDSEFQPDFLPDKMESGTPNTPGIIGLRKGIEYIQEKGIEQVEARKKILARELIKGFARITGVKVIGVAGEENIPTVSITVEGQDPGILAHQLSEEGILVRSGLHCCPAGHRALHTFPGGTLRFSPGFFNTEEEIWSAVDILKRLVLENN